MTVHLSKELERFVHDAVRAGCYATEDDVVNDAVARLQQTMPKAALTTGRGAKRRQGRTAEAQEATHTCGTGSVHAENRLAEPTARYRRGF